MKKLSLFIFLFTSCSPNQAIWRTNRNIHHEEIVRDENECYMGSIVQNTRWSVFPVINEKNYIECMETKGYREEIK